MARGSTLTLQFVEALVRCMKGPCLFRAFEQDYLHVFVLLPNDIYNLHCTCVRVTMGHPSVYM